LLAGSAVAVALPIAAAAAASTPPPALAVMARLAVLARLLRRKVRRLLHELVLGRHFVLGFSGEFVGLVRKRKMFGRFAGPSFAGRMELSR
jgi:hypothetical protein